MGRAVAVYQAQREEAQVKKAPRLSRWSGRGVGGRRGWRRRPRRGGGSWHRCRRGPGCCRRPRHGSGGWCGRGCRCHLAALPPVRVIDFIEPVLVWTRGCRWGGCRAWSCGRSRRGTGGCRWNRRRSGSRRRSGDLSWRGCRRGRCHQVLRGGWVRRGDSRIR